MLSSGGVWGGTFRVFLACPYCNDYATHRLDAQTYVHRYHRTYQSRERRCTFFTSFLGPGWGVGYLFVCLFGCSCEFQLCTGQCNGTNVTFWEKWRDFWIAVVCGKNRESLLYNSLASTFLLAGRYNVRQTDKQTTFKVRFFTGAVSTAQAVSPTMIRCDDSATHSFMCCGSREQESGFVFLEDKFGYVPIFCKKS